MVLKMSNSWATVANHRRPKNKKLKMLRQQEITKDRKKKRKDRLLKITLWYLVLGYKDIRNYIYRLINNEDIVVTIESMRTTFGPHIQKQLQFERQRKELKSATRKERKMRKKSLKKSEPVVCK